MAQVQQGTASSAPSSKLAVVAVGIAVAVAAIAFAAAIVVSSLSRPPTGSSVGADVDPFLTPLAIEFRAGERAGSVAASVSPDLLLTQEAIDFRADERAVSH